MGKKMRACLSITQNNLYKWVLNPRIYLVAVLLGAYFHSRIFPILQFCDHYQVGISPFLFPFFLSDDHVVLIVTLGAMLLFGDAPFIDLEQPYIVLRAGRKTWVWGANLLFGCCQLSVHNFYVSNDAVAPFTETRVTV